MMTTEEPFDAANQSLSDALRASFRILKGIMLVLVLLYLFSNVRKIESHEQALLLRLGRLSPMVYEAGFVWAFPFPVDAAMICRSIATHLLVTLMNSASLCPSLAAGWRG